MTHSQPTRPASAIARAQAYQDELAARAGEIEALRRLPQDIADRLAQDGLYTLCNPPEFGGEGASPRTYARVVEELSRGDASAGWCSFIAITASFAVASGNTPALRDLLNQPGTILAGVFAPNGRARRANREKGPDQHHLNWITCQKRPFSASHQIWRPLSLLSVF